MMIRCVGACLLILLASCQQEPTNDLNTVPPTVENAAQTANDVEAPDRTTPREATTVSEFKKTQSLFDGQTLGMWELTEFGGEGNVTVEDGCIVMNAGDPTTAINLPESFALPKTNYELEFMAMKVEGTDFFGTVTFPVEDSFCTMVVGGWAGTVVGLSSIDGVDASENETRSVKKFERQQWYTIRVRVTPESINGWIDDEQVINQSIVGKEVSIRSELIPCRPLGIANFYTIAKIKNIELRTLNVDESE